MRLENLFKVQITGIWNDAQNKRMSWDDANQILSIIHDTLCAIQVEKRYSRAVFWLAAIAYQRHRIECEEKMLYRLRSVEIYLAVNAL